MSSEVLANQVKSLAGQVKSSPVKWSAPSTFSPWHEALREATRRAPYGASRRTSRRASHGGSERPPRGTISRTLDGTLDGTLLTAVTTARNRPLIRATASSAAGLIDPAQRGEQKGVTYVAQGPPSPLKPPNMTVTNGAVRRDRYEAKRGQMT
ncbi:hypothetical protein ANO11243_001010 [Dothideomycetidae sp. 11243]|nr:hypothetical protein ANO11243_001010 [fungal sp. No.11243]